MAAFERTTKTSAAPARLALVPRAPADPMQRAIDRWYHEQPEIFAQPAESARSEDPDGNAGQDNMLGGAERAIALNHLLNYGRLAGARDLVALRERAVAGNSSVQAPLLHRLEVRNAELLSRAPTELYPALAAGFAATRDELVRKAAAIDAATNGRRQAAALEQSVALGEALLRQDPTQYETLLADAEAMLDGFGLEDGPRRALGASIRKRFASATISTQLDLVAGDLAQAEQDLQQGRFGDAFNDAEITTWRDFVAFQQKRLAVQMALATRDAEVGLELRMLNRLAAAKRGEAPMPLPAEVEQVFPGEGARRLATAEYERRRQLYATEIVLEPFDRDPAWITAGDHDDDILLRRAVVEEKYKQFAKSGGGNSLEQLPELAAAIEAGIEDPSKLNLAIDLYRRHQTKLGVPPRWVRSLPNDALRSIARQYHNLDTTADKREWLRRLVVGVGEERAETLLNALSGDRDLLPRGISALARIVAAPGNEAQVEAAIARLDHAQIAELSRTAAAFEGDLAAADAALGEFTPLRSDELARLKSADPTGLEFRTFVTEAREADASPHGLDLFARSHGLHPARLRLVLEIADVNAATPKAEITELNRRLMVLMPAVDADQGIFGIDIYKLEQRESVSEETKLRTIQELLPFATIRDPRDRDIDEQVVDAAMGMSHGAGPVAPSIASASSIRRWGPTLRRIRSDENAAPEDSSRRAEQSLDPAPNPPAPIRVQQDDSHASVAEKLRSYDGLDIESHPNPMVRQRYQELQVEIVRSKEARGWFGLSAGPSNQRIGAANQRLVEAVFEADGLNFRRGQLRSTGGVKRYIPDFVLYTRRGAESAIVDAKISQIGRWRWRRNQRVGMAHDRAGGLNTFGVGAQGSKMVVIQYK